MKLAWNEDASDMYVGIISSSMDLDKAVEEEVYVL